MCAHGAISCEPVCAVADEKRRGLVSVGLLRDEVVAGVVVDGVEVRHHAEVGRVLDLRTLDRVRRAAVGRRGVDVVGLDLVAGGLERGHVLREVARRGGVARGHVRRDAGVVLGGDDEHALLGRLAGRGHVGQRRDAVAELLLEAAGLDDHVDDVAGLHGTGADDAGEGRLAALEVVALDLVVALARGRGRHRDRDVAVAAADDRHGDVGVAELLADRGLDHLRGAVGDIEAVGLDVLGRLDLVVARVVVEVLRTTRGSAASGSR